MKIFYKTILLLFLNVSFLIFNSFSQQAPGIEWQNTIGGSESDAINSIQQTSDGGYILGGFSYSNISGDKTDSSNGAMDYWIVKLDASGNILWQNSIGGSAQDALSSLQQTSDGGYILGGSSTSDTSGDKSENGWGSFDYWLVKVDSAGNVQWDNTIGGDFDDRLSSVEQTSDGGYILGGFSISDSSGDKTESSWQFGWDYWVIKVDSAGNIQWQNTILANNFDYLFSIHQTFDGRYILGGQSASDYLLDKTEGCWGGDDYWIIKLDSTGNIQWQNDIGGTASDNLLAVQQTTDGGYILGGYSQSDISGDKTENSIGGSGDYDCWVIKLNSSGNIMWQNTIGGTQGEALSSIDQTADHGYILGAYSGSDISGDKTENSEGLSDYWVVKIDSVGNIQWDKTIGGSSTDYLNSIQQTSDGGYILGGTSNSNISGNKTENSNGTWDYWVVKLLPDTITSTFNIQHSASNINISPNPSSGIFQITFPLSSNQKTNYTLEVINTLGQTVFTSPPAPLRKRGESSAQLDLSFLPKGIYVLRLCVLSGKTKDDENSFSKKLIIQ